MGQQHRKVVVIGAGSVGTTYIYALLHTGLAGEIALIDIDRDRVEGEVMDLSHGLPFIPPVTVKPGDYADCADADMVVITAGAKQESGQSRTELIQKNADIIKAICEKIRDHGTDGVVVMVTNPVDTLTQLAIRCLDKPAGRVIGSGTMLDTARLKYMLSQHCRVNSHNVHAYVIGEHGDSEVVPWSLAHIAGISIEKYCQLCGQCDPDPSHRKVAEQVRDSAYHIIDYKGSTFYGIGLTLVRLSATILRNEKGVLTVSTLLDGQYGLRDICLSLPCVVGQGGVERVIAGKLTDDELTALKQSAEKLRRVYATVSA